MHHQPAYHALLENCLYVNIPSESAVEDLSKVLSQYLETIDSHLNPNGQIQRGVLSSLVNEEELSSVLARSGIVGQIAFKSPFRSVLVSRCQPKPIAVLP
jgi:hypothetical protein